MAGDENHPPSAEELLKHSGAAGGGCAYSVKGWWTYEVCFGKGVRQYHVSQPGIGDSLSLGTFEAMSRGEENCAASRPGESVGERLRFVEERHVGGDLCEGVSDDSRPGRPVEEGKARRSTTRWACAMDGGAGGGVGGAAVRIRRHRVHADAMSTPAFSRRQYQLTNEQGVETP